MAAALSLNHGPWMAANVAALLDDELTSDVTFVVSDKADVGARGGSQHSLIRRVDADVGASKESQTRLCRRRLALPPSTRHALMMVALASTGTGKAPRALAVVLDADFDDGYAGDGGGSVRSGQTALTAGRASRRAAAVAGDYAAAMRADAASDQSFQPPTFEFKGHRCLFAGVSSFFRELLYRPTTLAASGEPRVQLSPAVTPGAFTAVRSYIYTGKVLIEIGNAVEIVAAAAVLRLDDLLRDTISYIVTSLSSDNFFDVRHHMETLC